MGAKTVQVLSGVQRGLAGRTSGRREAHSGIPAAARRRAGNFAGWALVEETRPRQRVVRAQVDATRSDESAERPSRADVFSNENLERLELVAADDKVEDIMTPLSAVAAVGAGDTLALARRRLQENRVEGMPVVSDDKVVGIITRHDIRPLLKKAEYRTYFEQTLVSQQMSTPPVCVRPHARIGEAAGVMLAYKVHRLPVVDEAGFLLGIVSRTDIFQPLLRKKESIMGSSRRLWINGTFPDNSFVDLDGFDSLESVCEDELEQDFPAAVVAAGAAPQASWEVKYLFDGECPLCMTLVNMLKRRDDAGKICFVDLRDPDYDPRLNQGVTFEQGMKTIHVIESDNRVIEGPEALQKLYDVAGLGWLQRVMDVPAFSFVIGVVYKVIAALRLPLSGESMDTILAARRMRSAQNDDVDWQCDHDEDEGCEVPDDW